MKEIIITVITGLLGLTLAVVMIVGEIKCVYKMCTCNWDPIGKAEVFYTIGSFSGLGAIIGYINIPDK